MRVSRSRPSAPSASHSKSLDVIEIDTDGRIVAVVMFDPDDIDAAIEELDTPILVRRSGRVTRRLGRSSRRAYAGLNRRELPATTPDWVNIDHRPGTAIAPGEIIEYSVRRGTSPQT